MRKLIMFALALTACGDGEKDEEFDTFVDAVVKLRCEAGYLRVRDVCAVMCIVSE